MLNSNVSQRDENQHQQQFSISNRTTHENQYPFLKDISELMENMSIQAFSSILLTIEQWQLAQTLYEADVAKKQLYPKYKPENKTLLDHCKKIILKNHKKQWDEYRKSATIYKESILE